MLSQWLKGLNELFALGIIIRYQEGPASLARVPYIPNAPLYFSPKLENSQSVVVPPGETDRFETEIRDRHFRLASNHAQVGFYTSLLHDFDERYVSTKAEYFTVFGRFEPRPGMPIASWRIDDPDHTP